MTAENYVFVAWEEHIISQEKGNRIVHYYLKDSSGSSILAVVGTERSIRHMIYVVSEEFLQAYGCKGSINACTKWRARRETVDWLTSLVSKHSPPSTISNSERNESAQSLGSQKFPLAGVSNVRNHLPDKMIQVPRKLRVQTSEIVWSGDAWICCKQLKHYPAFRRNETSILVHSFVFIMAEEESHYIGYLEDLYEDKKGQKKVKVRWFHQSQEVRGVMPQLNPHPREVFITPHDQVISAECIDGPAIVLTPKHYEKCSVLVSQTLSPGTGIHMCFNQFKSHKDKPVSLNKLRGYYNQEILSSLDCHLGPKHKAKDHSLSGEEEEKFAQEDPTMKVAKGIRSSRAHQRLDCGHSEVTNSVPGKQIVKSEPTYRKLKIKLSSNGPIRIQLVGPEPHHQASSKVGEKIELLCQDSGICGCWFRCKVLQVSQKRLKVQYNDLEDVDGSGNLEEWVSASRVAAPDKLNMRYSGRLTIRPCPSEDPSNYSFEVGAAVDAWWSDGWWEGVVTGVDFSGSDNLHVYLPGEDRFLTLQRKFLRTSRDWVDDRWVVIKANPDVLSFISSSVGPNVKLPMFSTLEEESKRGDSAPVDCKVLTNSKLKAVEEETQELPGSAAAENLENMNLNLKKRVHISS